MTDAQRLREAVKVLEQAQKLVAALADKDASLLAFGAISAAENYLEKLGKE